MSRIHCRHFESSLVQSQPQIQCQVLGMACRPTRNCTWRLQRVLNTRHNNHVFTWNSCARHNICSCSCSWGESYAISRFSGFTKTQNNQISINCIYLKLAPLPSMSRSWWKRVAWIWVAGLLWWLRSFFRWKHNRTSNLQTIRADSVSCIRCLWALIFWEPELGSVSEACKA